MRKGFTLIELLVVIVIIGILIALALPNYIKAKDKAKEASTKNNLHSVQVTLERYATDHSGDYPFYIWGGDIGSWIYWFTGGGGSGGPYMSCDPLIRGGYLKAYPRNPFITTSNSEPILQLFQNDPRVGRAGDLMGNVLSDDRQWSPSSALVLQAKSGPWPGDLNGYLAFYGDGNSQTKDWIPGEMVYRTWGTNPRDLGTQHGVDPSAVNGLIEITHYILGSYGAERTEGRDALHGPGHAFDSHPAHGNQDYYQNHDDSVLPNIIFRAPLDENGNPIDPTGTESVLYMNPDGYKDGIVVVYTAGTDYDVNNRGAQ